MKKGTETENFTIKPPTPKGIPLPLYLTQTGTNRVSLMHGDRDDGWYLVCIKVNNDGKMYFSLATSVPDEIGFLLNADGSVVTAREGEDAPE